MGMAKKHGLMGQNIAVCMLMGKNQVMVHICGQINPNLRVNGKKTL
jgi:hypothetical protein